jgi:hydrogenase/urease accessory protein HupE
MKLTLLFLLLPAIALAHPISQGTLDLELSSDNIHVRARVPVEEVLVADALGSGSAASLGDAWREHRQYFLRHFQVDADGRTLTGSVSSVTAAANDHVIYELDYPLPATPRQLSLRQNLLNEIPYAPGNPWEATFVVRVSEQGRLTHEGLLLTSKQPLAVIGQGSGRDRGRMFGEYLRHGIAHILSGYDHLLFIAALALAAVTFWDLIKVVSAFTLAHTVTLTLSVLNIVRLPSHVVEPMIAASIVFVALSNVLWPRRSRGWARLATAFFFGLFHGLGFAGGLLDAMSGMAGVAVGVAIAAFSIGVELGHQMVVLPIFFGLKLARNAQRDDAGRHLLSLRSLQYGSAAISMAGVFYLIAALR